MADNGYDKKTIEITMKKAGLDPSVVLGERDDSRPDLLDYVNTEEPPLFVPPPPSVRASKQEQVSIPYISPRSTALKWTESDGAMDPNSAKTMRRTRTKRVFINPNGTPGSSRSSRAVSISGDSTYVTEPSAPPPGFNTMARQPSYSTLNSNTGQQSASRIARATSVENFSARTPRTSFNELHIDEFLAPVVSNSKLLRGNTNPSSSNLQSSIRKPVVKKDLSMSAVSGAPNAFENELQNTLRRRKIKKAEVSNDDFSSQQSVDDEFQLREVAIPFSTHAVVANSMDSRYQRKNSDFFQSMKASENGSSSRSVIQQNYKRQPTKATTISIDPSNLRESEVSSTTRTTRNRRPLSNRPTEELDKDFANQQMLSLRQKNGIPLKLFPFDSTVYKKYKAMQIVGKDPIEIVATMESDGFDPVALYKDINPNRQPQDPIQVDIESQTWELKYSKRYFQHYYQNHKTGEMIWKDEVEKLNGTVVEQQEALEQRTQPSMEARASAPVPFGFMIKKRPNNTNIDLEEHDF